MTNYYKVLSFVLIAALIGGFNLLYSLHDIPYILQEVIYFVPFFIILIWIGYIFFHDINEHHLKSERNLLKGIIIATCLLFFVNISLNLIGLKYLDFQQMENLRSIGEIKEARRLGYKEFREFIDLALWNYLSLSLLIVSLLVTAFQWRNSRSTGR